MSYEKITQFNEFLDLRIEFEFRNHELVCINWECYDVEGFGMIPDKETAEEIEIFIANWLEKEYSKNGMNYISDMQDYLQEKRWEV